MINDGAAPTVINCIFSSNMANAFSGGMYNSGSSPLVTDCTFTGNSAGNGGGMHNNSSSNPGVIGCTFIDNTAGTRVGGMYNSTTSAPSVTDCGFLGNTTGDDGGGMYKINSNPSIANCVFSGNSTTAGFGHSGGGAGNINADPLFADAAGVDNTVGTLDDDLRLTAGSPCIDAGDSGAVPVGITTDLGGLLRFIAADLMPDTGVGPPPIVDMGAYKYAIFGSIDESAGVTMTDFALFAKEWMKTGCGLCGGADFTDDNSVTLEDLLVQVTNWLSGI